jgi:hypothetical protein
VLLCVEQRMIWGPAGIGFYRFLIRTRFCAVRVRSAAALWSASKVMLPMGDGGKVPQLAECCHPTQAIDYSTIIEGVTLRKPMRTLNSGQRDRRLAILITTRGVELPALRWP